MQINFYKYQGTGNDFILLDNRQNEYAGLTNEQVQLMCDRHMGIGADGLMLLNTKDNYDFEMIYYNADGNKGTMCGNGGRCLVNFAAKMGIKKDHYLFSAVDGDHEAKIDAHNNVSLKINNVNQVKDHEGNYILNTGSPHYIKYVSNIKALDVFTEGSRIRNSKDFAAEGINVNFVEKLSGNEIFVCTFERGVEDETLSCGTGVTAAALVSAYNSKGYNRVDVRTKGGRLAVEFDKINDSVFENIWLTGPAEFVFHGTIQLTL